MASSRSDEPRKHIPRKEDVTEEEFQRFMNSIPMFATERPEDADKYDVYNAMEALAAECTPEERAAEFKENGNECYRAGQKHWKDAVVHYTQGIILRCADVKLHAALLANRGLVLQKLGQHGHAIRDFEECVAVDEGNHKAWYRAAGSAKAVRRFEDAQRFCEGGLAVDGLGERERAALEKLLGDVNAAAAKEELRLLRERRAKDRLRRQRAKLDEAVARRGVRVERPFADVDEDAFARAPVALDEAADEMRWPVMLMYPEHMQTDFIQAFAEGACVKDHLAHMFPPAGDRPPWDAAGAYTAGSLAVYLVLGEGRAARVDASAPLLDVLRTDGYAAPLVPALHVLPRGSPAESAFLGEHGLL